MPISTSIAGIRILTPDVLVKPSIFQMSHHFATELSGSCFIHM